MRSMCSSQIRASESLRAVASFRTSRSAMRTQPGPRLRRTMRRSVSLIRAIRASLGGLYLLGQLVEAAVLPDVLGGRGVFAGCPMVLDRLQQTITLLLEPRSFFVDRDRDSDTLFSFPAVLSFCGGLSHPSLLCRRVGRRRVGRAERRRRIRDPLISGPFRFGP